MLIFAPQYIVLHVFHPPHPPTPSTDLFVVFYYYYYSKTQQRDYYRDYYYYYSKTQHRDHLFIICTLSLIIALLPLFYAPMTPIALRTVPGRRDPPL